MNKASCSHARAPEKVGSPDPRSYARLNSPIPAAEFIERAAMSAPADKPVKKVVLAYSGGLDTSIILKWLQTEYNAEVVTFTADLGQGEELGPAREKALKLGIKPENIFIDDLREEFVRDFVFPMFRANAQYEGDYLLGTSIARPLISKRQIEIARQVGADAVCHGATGKGKVLEDPAVEAPEFVHQRTISPEDAPDVATVIEIGFEKGDAVSINGEAMSPATILTALNQYGHDNGIGRLDLVENRFVGMKSRGVYETPGGTILIAAHRGIEIGGA